MDLPVFQRAGLHPVEIISDTEHVLRRHSNKASPVWVLFCLARIVFESLFNSTTKKTSDIVHITMEPEPSTKHSPAPLHHRHYEGQTHSALAYPYSRIDIDSPRWLWLLPFDPSANQDLRGYSLPTILCGTSSATLRAELQDRSCPERTSPDQRPEGYV